MFANTTHNTTPIATKSVTLSSLKNELFKSWFYCDVDFVIEDRDLPVRAYEIMQKVSVSLRAIAIMYPDDIDCHRLWQTVRPLLSHMLDSGWSIRVGDADGALCVRIFDDVSATDEDIVEFEVPREGTRQLRNVDAWCNAIGFIQ